MSAPPERPCNDVGRIDASLREAVRFASDLLDRPADEKERLVAAAGLVFLGVGLFACRWMAAIMAKASMTSET